MEKDAGVVTTTLSDSGEIVRAERNGTHTEEAPKNSFTVRSSDQSLFSVAD
jgi:hypothetical protein